MCHNVCKVLFMGNVFAVEPPLFVELTVTETEPGFKGDTAVSYTHLDVYKRQPL